MNITLQKFINRTTRVLLSGALASIFLMATTAFTHAATTSSSSGGCDDAGLAEQINSAGGSEIINNIPKICTIEQAYGKFIYYALFFIGIVAVIALIYGGYLYMISRGNPGEQKKARDVITWSAIGVLVVMLAAAILSAVINFIA